MKIEIPPELKNNKNKSVLEFLKPLSCHGDIIGPIYGFLKKEKEVKFFCPDPLSFRYCFWYIENSIFAFASGMQHIGLLLPDGFNVEAVSSGAVESQNLDGNWFLFSYKHTELKKWIGLALASAKSS